MQVGLRHEECIEPFLAGGADDARHGDIGNAGKPADGALYLLYLYSESVYFNLMIDSAMEFQVSLIVPTPKVARPVHSGTLRGSGVKFNEILARQLWIIHVTSS